MKQLTLRDGSRQDDSVARTHQLQAKHPNITGIHRSFIAFVKSFPQGSVTAAEETGANVPNSHWETVPAQSSPTIIPAHPKNGLGPIHHDHPSSS